MMGLLTTRHGERGDASQDPAGRADLAGGMQGGDCEEPCPAASVGRLAGGPGRPCVVEIERRHTSRLAYRFAQKTRWRCARLCAPSPAGAASVRGPRACRGIAKRSSPQRALIQGPFQALGKNGWQLARRPVLHSPGAAEKRALATLKWVTVT